MFIVTGAGAAAAAIREAEATEAWTLRSDGIGIASSSAEVKAQAALVVNSAVIC